MFVGHPLQCLSKYERWFALAATEGKRNVIIASHNSRFRTDFRERSEPSDYLPFTALSPKKKGLACFALSGSPIMGSRAKGIFFLVVFDGDSGSANISFLYLFSTCEIIADQVCLCHVETALHSPAINFTAAETRNTSRVEYDSIFEWTSIFDYVNDTLRLKAYHSTPLRSHHFWRTT